MKNSGLPTNTYFFKLIANENKIYAGTYGDGVFLSTNDGASWIGINNGLPPSITVTSFEAIYENIFIGTLKGVFLTTNAGSDWSDVSEGMTNKDVKALVKKGNYIYAGTTSGLWKRPLSEIVSLKENQEPVSITSYSLDQNYPNPFNPSTIIKYSIPAKQFVTLKVFNTLGQIVETLVNEEKKSGSYEIEFNAQNLPSGVYVYQLTTETYTTSRKMILIQ